eukprot:TRINITY_DN6168_c0_g1_i1.p1 TRINITY_DN6168_c0_g1~~TRINITY_DN6168_c0_g1_i1.p1  ORF type:complete len:216 (-),score=41.82 TRINITY_DN6168_c0_g1_i1:55-702(-)
METLISLSLLVLLPFASVAAQNSISSCSIGEECISIKTCAPIVEQLTRAKETSDVVKKRSIISQVREKVCGERSQRLICCPQEGNQGSGRQVKIGSFKNIFHDIGGEAYALDSQTILIKGFTYDGEGPDAFFLAGTTGKPSRANGDVVLPYPFEGKHFTYSDRNIPLLLRSFDGEEIVLTLPPGKTVDQLRWISVWCRDYQINFGHVTFPRNLKF